MRCEGNRLSRRNLLTVGAVGGLGLTLADFFAMREAQADQKHYDFIEAKAQSVIHIFLPGGMAHQESFDPKPYAPIEYRGEMGIDQDQDRRRRLQRDAAARRPRSPTRSPSCRSMTHGEAAHERGTHNMFTGYRPSPALQFPEHGQRGQPRVRPAQQPAAVRLHSESAERTSPARGYLQLVVRPVQPGQPTRPTAASRCRT